MVVERSVLTEINEDVMLCPAKHVDIQPVYFAHSLAKNERFTCIVLKIASIQTSRESVSF